MWAIFHAIKRSWTQHFVAQFSGFIIMLMTYGAVLFISLSLVNIQQLFDIWGQVNKVTIYMQPKVSQENHQEVTKFLSSSAVVKEFHKVSSEQSAKSFNKKFSKISSQKISTKQLSSFFPEYYEVSLNENLAYKSGTSHLENLASSLTSQFGSIKNVSYGKKWLSRYMSLLSLVKNIGWFLIFIFMIAAVIVSSNVIKTILFSRRDEIEILEFVGADDISIYLPQVINVILLSAVAFLSALGVNYGVLQSLKNSSGEVISPDVLSQLSFLPISVTLAMFFVCIASIFTYAVFTIFSLMPRYKKVLLVDEVFN